MRVEKSKKRKIIVILIICLVCIAAALIPYFNHATVTGGGSRIDFYGYPQDPILDKMIVAGSTSSTYDNVVVSYTVDQTEQYVHSCFGSGFLINMNSEGQGYFLVIGGGLYYLDGLDQYGIYKKTHVKDMTCGHNYFTVWAEPSNVDTPFRCVTGGTSNGEYITGGTTCGTGTYSYDGPHQRVGSAYAGSGGLGGNSKLQEVTIEATQTYVKLTVNGSTSQIPLPYATGGSATGPAVQFRPHNCPEQSHIVYRNVTSATNVKPPVADFYYNISPIADMRTPVVVTNMSKDGNVPEQSLTSYWRVYKDGVVVYQGNSDPGALNQWGAGKYTTQLQVKNDSGLWSSVVSKDVEITNNPRITIEPYQDEYYAGDKVMFRCSEWFNCDSKPADITITNVVSDNLFNPSVFLIGANGMTSVSGDLSAEIEFEYADGSVSKQSVTVPPNGLTVEDTANRDKAVKQITVIYKQFSNQADLKPDSYILYSYETSKDLSKYYSGGINPRRYEISNSVTLTVEIASGPVSASSTAKTSLVEKRASLSLKGTVDNNNAITLPPDCNTEFLLTGTSIGGETISKYIVVTKGISDSLEIPYGSYIISEEPSFTPGYDNIEPMELVIDDNGITVNKKVVINDGGEISFTKVLQTAEITVERIYESEFGINIESDTDFKATLIGSPVVKEISASFELISPKTEPVYYWEDKSTLILPIGSYMIKETQAYRLVSLEDILVSEETKWNRILNLKDIPQNGKANFLAENGDNIPVVLKYKSDEYVYDEYVYENSIYFDVDIVNFEGETITDSNLNKILVDPSAHKYPIRLVNTTTNEDYCGIIEPGKGITFKYMPAGEYEIICSNNMYVNYDRIKELNSDNLDFFEKNGKNYVGVPEDYASGEYKETSKFVNWRGYSNLSSKSSIMNTDTLTHVSLILSAIDHEKNPIANCEIRFMDEDEPVYFVNRHNKWYPAEENTPGATSVLKTDKHGDIEIYKFPDGEYIIEQATVIDSLKPVSLPQALVVDGTRNMGVKVVFVNENEIDSPSFITLAALKNSIDINESLILSDKISPITASKNVTYISTNGNIASVSSDGIVTGKTVGSTVIKVMSDKDNVIGEYEITVYDSSNPEMASLRQTISNIKLEIGESYKALATYSPSTVKSPNITWTSADPAIATVSSDGIIKGIGIGTTDVTATCGELTAICRVTVGKTLVPVQEISLDKSYLKLIYNSSALSQDTIKATISPDNASDTSVTFTSSMPNIVSVDANGNITAKAAGTAIITASSANGISSSCVVSSVPIIDKITLNADSLTLTKGSSAKIMAKTSPVGSQNEDTLVWKSSNSSIVSVDEDGTITANEIGKAIVSITASYPGADDVVAECQINVVTDEISATGIEIYVPVGGETDWQLLTGDFEMGIGDIAEFAAGVTPSSTTNPEIEWSYSRANVVAIGPANTDEFNPSNTYNRYKILANGDSGGETTVTGRVKGTDVTVKFKVIVDSPGTGIEITGQKNRTLVLDIDPTFTVAVQYDNMLSKERNINWTLSDDTKAALSLSENKKEVTVTAKEAGTVTLTAEVEFRLGGTYTDSIEITIEEPRIDILVDDTNISAIDLNKGGSQIFVFQPNCSKESYGPLACTFDDYDKHIISINSVPEYNTAKGWAFEVVGLASGTTTIAVNPTSSLFGPIYITVTVDGESSRVDTYFNGIVGNNITIDSGSTETITLKANCPNEGYEISINDATIISGELTLDESTLDGIITVTGLSAGTTTITVTPKYTEIAPFDITITVI